MIIGKMSDSEGGNQIGRWTSDPDDPEAIATYGDVLLDFSRNGALTYKILADGKRQIMLLMYRIEGDVLVTDQPSAPKEERTNFRFTLDGKLILEQEGRPSTYVRVGDAPPLLSNVNPN